MSKKKKQKRKTFRLHDWDHADTKSKFSVSVYCQNHSRRFHSWYKTHMKALNIGKKHYSLNTIRNEQPKSVSHGHMHA